MTAARAIRVQEVVYRAASNSPAAIPREHRGSSSPDGDRLLPARGQRASGALLVPGPDGTGTRGHRGLWLLEGRRGGGGRPRLLLGPSPVGGGLHRGGQGLSGRRRPDVARAGGPYASQL